MAWDYLLLENEDAVATLTINRPDKLNALTEETMDEMIQAFDSLANDSSVKVVLLKGAGEKAFVAGGDIGVMQPLTPLQARRVALKAQKLFDMIEQSPKPVIAVLQGYTLGGGCELAMACDIRIAGEKAKLGQPEVNLGIIPGFGGTQRLPRLVGPAKAKELLFTGEMLSAAEAEKLGLVNKVVPQDELAGAALKMAQTIATKSAVALQLNKEAVNNGMQMELKRAIEYEADLFGLCFSTHDQKEGMKAFLEKRPAEFRDE